MFIAPIFERKGKIQKQACEYADRLHVKNVEGPIGEQVEQAGSVRFVVDHQIITADSGVDEIDNDDVNIRPNRDSRNGFPRGTETLNNSYVDCGGNDQSVRDECLEEAEMREAVDSKIGRDQRLNRAADAEEVHEFVDRIILRDEHQRASPHQQTAQVKREHGLDRPCADGIIPCVPRNFIDQQNQRKRPADFALGRLAGVVETDEE